MSNIHLTFFPWDLSPETILKTRKTEMQISICKKGMILSDTSTNHQLNKSIIMKTQLLKTIAQQGKALSLVLAIGVSALTSDAQTWGTQSTFITDNVNGISFREGSDEGIAVAAGGRIIKTTDGGLNWTLQNSGTVKDLYAVHMTSLDSAYAVGDSGLVLMTGNGGATWSPMTSGTSEQLNDIYVRDGKGFIVGDNGVILMIDGTTITNSPSNSTSDLTGVYVVDGSTAFVSGGAFLTGTILATFNNGNVWTPLTTGTLNTLNSIWFINDSTGYAAGNLGTILKTTNSGSTWTTQTTGTSTNLNSICFLTADSGYAVGGAGLAMRTINGGTTWTTSTTGVAAALNDVAFPANYEGYAAGNTGTIIKTCPYVYFDIMPNDSICINSGATFSNMSHNGASFAWEVDGDTVGTNTNYFDTYDSAGVYSIRLNVSNGTCAESYTRSLYVADTPTVDLGPDTAICSSCTITLNAGNIGSDYIWYKDGIATGAVTQTNTVGIAGTYSVQVTSPSGCEAWDSIEVTIATGLADVNNKVNHISVHPNPNNRLFILGFNVNDRQTTEVKISNYMGMTVYNETLSDFSGQYTKEISLEKFSAGVYFVNIITDGKTQSVKVITY
jgi:photosystem II stability/assembly factor-like uncharacterized protein